MRSYQRLFAGDGDKNTKKNTVWTLIISMNDGDKNTDDKTRPFKHLNWARPLNKYGSRVYEDKWAGWSTPEWGWRNMDLEGGIVGSPRRGGSRTLLLQANIAVVVAAGHCCSVAGAKAILKSKSAKMNFNDGACLARSLWGPFAYSGYGSEDEAGREV